MPFTRRKHLQQHKWIPNQENNPPIVINKPVMLLKKGTNVQNAIAMRDGAK